MQACPRGGKGFPSGLEQDLQPLMGCRRGGIGETLPGCAKLSRRELPTVDMTATEDIQRLTKAKAFPPCRRFTLKGKTTSWRIPPFVARKRLMGAGSSTLPAGGVLLGSSVLERLEGEKPSPVSSTGRRALITGIEEVRPAPRGTPPPVP